jgi:hypothetical protein
MENPVITAYLVFMIHIGVKDALLVTNGSRYRASTVVAHCQRSESITERNIGIVTAAILNFLRRSHEQKEAYHDQDH